jgi:hypothetical protein
MAHDHQQVQQLLERGALHDVPQVEPRFDARLGVIVGDSSKLDGGTLPGLLQERDAHLQGLADKLASELEIDRRGALASPFIAVQFPRRGLAARLAGSRS